MLRSRRSLIIVGVLVLTAFGVGAQISKEAQHAQMQGLQAQLEELRAQGQGETAAFQSLYQELLGISAALGGDWPQATPRPGQPAVDGRAAQAPEGTIGVVPPVPFGCTSSVVSVTNSTPVTISASGTPTVTSTVVVSGAGSYIWDVNLRTFITHTFSADLDITLQSPSGTVVTLTTDNGGANDNVFNGTIWDDQANPSGQVPYTTNNGLASDHAYANLTLASPLVPEEAMTAFRGENPNGTWTLTISDDASGDGGSLNSWTLEVITLPSAPPLTQTLSVTNNTPVAIPSGPAVVTSTVSVSGLQGTILDVDLQTFITHTFNADLDITLQSPSGTVVTLTTDNGGSFDNVFNGTVWNDQANPSGQVPYTTNNGLASDHAYANLTLASPLVPEEAMGAFQGEDPNGTWTLTISDDATPDGGNLSSWTLTIVTSACSCGLSCPSNQMVSNAPNQCGATVSYSPPSILGGICGTVMCSPASGSFFTVGTTGVTCNGSLAGSCSFNVTVNDTQAPTVSVPSVTVPNTPGQCSAVVTYTPTASDNCSVASVNCVPPSGSTFSVGTTPVNCTVQDPSGNNGTGSGTVTVNDVEAPVLTCPANVTVTVPPGSMGTNVTFPAPGVSDNCPGVGPASCVPPSGSAFPVGTTVVSCSASDASSNSGSCNLSVRVTALSIQSIPTVSALGLAALGVLLAGGALWLLRRRG